jgi:transcriptional regulator with XRE-family HTH domain
LRAAEGKLLSRMTDIAVAHRGTSPSAKVNTRARQRTDHSTALLTTISINLKRLRTRQGHSLERLAKLAGVSRAMLSQIETGKSVPTISLLLKIADALGVPIANLLVAPTSRATIVLPRTRAKIVSASNGRFTSRALFPLESTRRAEFYEVRIGAQHRETFDPQAAGTKQNILVVEGRVELTVGNEAPVIVPQGDAVQFHADVPHTYRNLEPREAVVHLVLTYVEPVGHTHPFAFAGE